MHLSLTCKLCGQSWSEKHETGHFQVASAVLKEAACGTCGADYRSLGGQQPPSRAVQIIRQQAVAR